VLSLIQFKNYICLSVTEQAAALFDHLLCGMSFEVVCQLFQGLLRLDFGWQLIWCNKIPTLKGGLSSSRPCQ